MSKAGDKKEKTPYGSRLSEMRQVLKKHKITRGISPEKLRLILEDLGPTYIKLGQIMSLHSDVLPKRYCDELMKLQSEVPPMPFEQVIRVLEDAYGIPWDEVFSGIDEVPLGSASIAQVHRAVLKNGDVVVLKVQREGIYETMSQDIALLRRAVRFLPPVSIKETVDLDLVLEELWTVAQDEMNFQKEASNLEEFAHRNRDVAYVSAPRLYREYTNARVLVQEYIAGYAIDDKENLIANGYDLDEIGAKFADSFMKQVMDDGFFHADPHPGNVRICEGKIVWIDMGMMGRLSYSDRDQITLAVKGVAANDVGMIEDAVLAIGEFRGTPDKVRLYTDISDLLSKYRTTNMGDIDVTGVLQDLMEVMKTNKIIMPHGLTMLARGLTHMEGVLADISPEINMMEIAVSRVKAHILSNFDLKKEMLSGGKKLYRSLYKAVDLPNMAADALESYMRGQSRINLDLKVSKDLSDLLRHLVRNIVMGLWIMALLISSSIICTTDMQPKLCGIPVVGAFGYIMAFVIVMYVFIRHFLSKK